MEWLSKLLDIGKIPTKIIFWIFLLTGLLLLLPTTWLVALRLDQFLTDYGKYVGICFVGASVLLLIHFFIWILNKSRQSKQKKEYQSAVEEKLNRLDDFEKAVLREFYLQGKNTILLPVDDPTVAGLLQKRVLSIVSPTGEMSLVGILRSVSLSSIAESLTTPQLIGLPNGTPSQAQLTQIAESRPKFIAGIERRNWLMDI